MSLTISQRAALGAVQQWYETEDKFFVIEGPAGTGKTYLCNTIIQELGLSYRDVCVSAPTHKAKLVLSEKTDIFGKSLAELMGLGPNVDVAKYDPNNPEFIQKKKPLINNYDLVIVDEASMIPKELLELIKSISITKVLFLGDPFQLPPVKENESMVFFDDDIKRAKLVDLVRQKNDNPLVLFLSACRSDIFTEERGYFVPSTIDIIYELLDDFNISNTVIPRDNIPSIAKQAKLLPYLLKKIAHEDFNVDLYYGRVQDEYDAFMEEAMNASKTNPTELKYIAYFNDSLKDYNNKLSTQVKIGDVLMGYNSIWDDSTRTMKLYNSLDYTVVGMDEVERHMGIKCRLLDLESDYHNTYIRLVEKDSYQEFLFKHTQYLAQGWSKYNKNFKCHFAVIDNLRKLYPDVKYAPTKDLDFSYGITVHKSQGSTYDEVYVNVRDILRTKTMSGELFVKKLLYVALSRARYKVHLLL